MNRIGKLRFYFGTEGWGWKMYGIGWDTLWFAGFSIATGDKHE